MYNYSTFCTPNTSCCIETYNISVSNNLTATNCARQARNTLCQAASAHIQTFNFNAEKFDSLAVFYIQQIDSAVQLAWH